MERQKIIVLAVSAFCAAALAPTAFAQNETPVVAPGQAAPPAAAQTAPATATP
ncbi:MAG: response regulator, partial [Armatimonadetes bacterium]|nr:response regulator [Armatimonadota bacterium]